MELTLTIEECELVLEILAERHRALLREISHTDHREFKLLLLKREKLLESVENRLRVMQPALEPMSELRR
jgi:Lon protease-like protein